MDVPLFSSGWERVLLWLSRLYGRARPARPATRSSSEGMDEQPCGSRQESTDTGSEEEPAVSLPWSSTRRSFFHDLSLSKIILVGRHVLTPAPRPGTALAVRPLRAG